MVAGASIEGRPYKDVLGLIKAAGRPLDLTFALAPRQGAGGADPTAGLTGRAAQKALQVNPYGLFPYNP